jgi:hypothetical protein
MTEVYRVVPEGGARQKEGNGKPVPAFSRQEKD